jgi:hypothetical protein
LVQLSFAAPNLSTKNHDFFQIDSAAVQCAHVETILFRIGRILNRVAPFDATILCHEGMQSYSKVLKTMESSGTGRKKAIEKFFGENVKKANKAEARIRRLGV